MIPFGEIPPLQERKLSVNESRSASGPDEPTEMRHQVDSGLLAPVAHDCLDTQAMGHFPTSYFTEPLMFGQNPVPPAQHHGSISYDSLHAPFERPVLEASSQWVAGLADLEPYTGYAYPFEHADPMLTPLPRQTPAAPRKTDNAGHLHGHEQDMFLELVSMAREHQTPQDLYTVSPSARWPPRPVDVRPLPTMQDYRDIDEKKHHYELVVVQEPCRARMCGFGDKDRRPVTPPPIVKLIVKTPDGQEVNVEHIDISFLVMVCDSWCADQVTEANLVYHSVSVPLIRSSSSSSPSETTRMDRMRNLVGASVASATKLYDVDGVLGIFFVFQDISFRIEGQFCLAFSLADIGSLHDHVVNLTTPSRILARVYSNLFTVYTAKKFPGVVPSTALSQCFAKQGVKIPIRKDTKKGRPRDDGSDRTSPSQGASTYRPSVSDEELDPEEA